MSEQEPEYESETQVEEPELEEQPKRVKRPKRIAVRVIQRKGQTACVQWSEGEWPRRGWIPVEEVRDNQATEDALKAAVPVGVRWEERLDLTLDNEALARALYRHNLFTLEDFAAKPVGMAAIREALGPLYKAILRIAEE